MKKYLPVTFLIAVLGFYLVYNNQYVTVSNAGPTTKEKKTYAHYEAVLKNLKGKTINGKEISFAKMKTPKVVILNFWASWCTPCLEEFPSLVKFYKEFKDNKDVLVVGINTDDADKMKEVKKTIKKYGLNFDSILDIPGDILDLFKINMIPVTIVYKNGKVHEVSNGAKDFEAEEFKTFIKKAIE
ncbi:MAG: TlpA family protein disulfide reductase [Oligoflexia bacterium]|nr:TlpA family protein disulfide reductase [Oligoflexia bacterium]